MTILRILFFTLWGLSLQSDAAPAQDQALDPAILVFTDYPGWNRLRALSENVVIPREVATQEDATAAFVAGSADFLAISQVDLLAMIGRNPEMAEIVILFPLSISTGADFVIGRGRSDAADIAGRRIGLTRETVSHYLLARELEAFSQDADTKPIIVNLSQEEIEQALLTDRVEIAVLRSPDRANLLERPEFRMIFDSRSVGRGIVDLLVMRRDKYRSDPDLVQRVTQAWFSGLTEDAPGPGTSRRGITSVKASRQMMGTGEFMFTILRAMDFLKVQRGAAQGSTSLNTFAIRFADGTVIGDPANVRIEVPLEHLLPPLP